MRHHQLSSAHRHQQGFTLVEIGVVLVIIGLLLGAVLKGQELIASARVSNLISNMNGYKAAINAFEDRYRMLPGDSSQASTKVGNGAIDCVPSFCNGICCDNGWTDHWYGVSLVNNHLLASGIYSGPALMAPSGDPLASSTGYLTNPGGGPIFRLAWNAYLDPNGAQPIVGNEGLYTGWALSSKLLGEVDRKTDDGNGWTGRMRASTYRTQSSGCVSSTNGVWIENNPGTNCGAVELLR